MARKSQYVKGLVWTDGSIEDVRFVPCNETRCSNYKIPLELYEEFKKKREEFLIVREKLIVAVRWGVDFDLTEDEDLTAVNVS